ncbi:MAG: hypothetical protein GY799_25695 [Desulfobulbaceae bacterium]|nr:hypothetical protein [Desulfobulbaceae bacterium]
MALVQESYMGAGVFFIDGRDIGNTIESNLAFTQNVIKQKTSRSPGGGTYASVTRVEDMTLSITVGDWSGANLAVGLFGATTEVAGGAVADESIAVPAALTTDILVPVAKLLDIASSVTVTSDPAGTTHVEGTDYEINAMGIQIIAGGGISASDPLLVTYTSLTSIDIQAVVNSGATYDVMFSGTNESIDNQPRIFHFYKWKPGPTEGLNVISTDDFGNLVLSGEVVLDTTKTGAGVSQYFESKALKLT